MTDPTTPTLGKDGFPVSGWVPPSPAPQLAPGASAPSAAAAPAPVAATSAPPAQPAAPVAAQPPAAPIAKIAGEPKTYALAHPVEFDGTTYAAVTIRSARTGDLAKIDRAAGARALHNVALLLATPDGGPVPLPVIEALEAGDGTAIVDLAEPILSRVIAPKTTARFAGAEHATTILLRCPIDFDGRVFDKVVVRRLTARDFQTFFDSPPEQRGRLPAFVDDDGKPLPDAVLDAVGYDDNAAIMEALEVFIPDALKVERASRLSSAPQAGEASPAS